MSKEKPSAPPYDLSAVPVYYADQPAGVSLGPHVSRLTFGISEDDDNDYPRPVVTVAIPTISLLAMVTDLTLTLNDPAFKKDMNEGLASSAKRISAGIGSKVSEPFQRVGKIPKEKRSPRD